MINRGEDLRRPKVLVRFGHFKKICLQYLHPMEKTPGFATKLNKRVFKNHSHRRKAKGALKKA